MRKLRDLLDGLLCRRLAHYRLPQGKRRIYFHHIRKTAGTSLCQMMLVAAANRTPADGDALWDDLWAAHRHRRIHNGKIFVAGEKRLIEAGHYFFAASHLPAHGLTLPPDTFTITCLRDPVKRVLSHYHMLLAQQATEGQAFRKEGHWLGHGFDDFLDRIPPAHLLRQLYTFSATFDPDEAFARITACDLWCFTDGLNRHIPLLSAHTGLPLQPRCANRSRVAAPITPGQLTRLQQKLAPELMLYDRLKAQWSKTEGMALQPEQQHHQRIGQTARAAMA